MTHGLRHDIVFAMTGDVHRNTRALRQLGALSDAGFSVRLLALPPSSIQIDLPPGVDPLYVSVPPGKGPRHFRAVHSMFSEALQTVRASVYHASDLYVLRAVRRAARRTGNPFTYDARELYAHVAATAGRPWVSRFWRWFEGAPAREAAAVWTVSDSIADHLATMHSLRRPEVQLNAPVAGEVEPDPHLRELAGVDPGTPLFVHLGQMRAGRGGDALIRAFAAVPDARLVFLGYGPEQPGHVRLASELDISERVLFVDPVAPDRIRAVLRAADVGVTLLEDTCLNHRFALPNKLFDYFAAGLPVLASRLPELGRIVDQYDTGLTVDPTDRDALASSIRRMASDADARLRWSANSRAAAETFDWRKASERFVTSFQNLLAA